MQVLKVTLGVLILCISAIFSLKFYGKSLIYEAYDHPVLKLPNPWVLAWGGELSEGPSHSLKAFNAAAKLKGVMLAANVQLNAQNHFYIISQEFDGKNKVLGSRKFINYSDNEVKEINIGNGESPMALEELFKRFSQMPILIWLNDNSENIDLRLEPIIKKYGNRSNILVHSEYDNVCKSLKKLLPQLLYGTGVGQRIRLLMLGSMGLESVASLDGDFLVSPIEEHGVSALSSELKNELFQRKKIFILGPLTSIKENDNAIRFGATGYLTSYPKDLINKF